MPNTNFVVSLLCVLLNIEISQIVVPNIIYDYPTYWKKLKNRLNKYIKNNIYSTWTSGFGWTFNIIAGSHLLANFAHILPHSQYHRKSSSFFELSISSNVLIFHRTLLIFCRTLLIFCELSISSKVLIFWQAGRISPRDYCRVWQPARVYILIYIYIHIYRTRKIHVIRIFDM